MQLVWNTFDKAFLGLFHFSNFIGYGGFFSWYVSFDKVVFLVVLNFSLNEYINALNF
jgi:hypothetical protein